MLPMNGLEPRLESGLLPSNSLEEIKKALNLSAFFYCQYYPILTDVMVNEPAIALSLNRDTSSLLS